MSEMQAAHTLLRRRLVEARTGLARSTLYQRIADGTFPKPIHLGPRSVAWIESEVDVKATAPLPTAAPDAFGRGFGRRNVFLMRAFYLACPRPVLESPGKAAPSAPIVQTLSTQSWLSLPLSDSFSPPS
jgi:prophage regulatory protein